MSKIVSRLSPRLQDLSSIFNFRPLKCNPLTNQRQRQTKVMQNRWQFEPKIMRYIIFGPSILRKLWKAIPDTQEVVLLLRQYGA